MFRKAAKTILFYAFASLFAFFALLPFFWMLSTSFKGDGALLLDPIEWIPKAFSTEAYASLFDVIKPDFFLTAAMNSVFVSVATTCITLLCASMAAYAFSKIEYRHKGKIFVLFLATMMVPAQVTTIPIYIVLSRIGLLNTYRGLLLPTIFNAFAVFLLRQNISKIHNDYIDAAIMDGAGHFRVYKNIVLPMSAPTLAALGVIAFMGAWNDYYWPLIVLNDQKKATLQLALSLLNGQYFTKYNILMAGSLISMAPIIIIYLFAQKHFHAGLQFGGIKG